jgi:hypothetical protein
LGKSTYLKRVIYKHERPFTPQKLWVFYFVSLFEHGHWRALPPPPPPHDYFLLPKNIAQTIAAGLSAALPISLPTTNRLVG